MSANPEIPVLAETADYLVIDKPAGLTVHNDNLREASVLTTLGGTLYPVHRIDKETTGLLLLAKTKAAAAELAQQFQNHQVRKVYQALLRGSLKPESIQWSWPLSDKAEGRQNPQGLALERKNCHTEGHVLQRNDYFSLIEVEIKTGRQHQIRKHAAMAKHPIVGDSRYNDAKYNQMTAKRYQLDRMFLHAAVLEIHWQSQHLKFASPLPAAFEKLLPQLPPLA